MRIIRGLPKYTRTLKMPYGAYADEPITASSVAQPIQEVLNNIHFINSKVSALKDIVYDIGSTSTTAPATTNINQVPVRMLADNGGLVIMSSSEVSKLVTVQYSRQNYTSGEIAFKLSNMDENIRYATHIQNITDSAVVINIQRNGVFYGHTTFTLEAVEAASGQKLNSVLITLKTDPVADALKSKVTRAQAWFPAFFKGTQTNMSTYIQTIPVFNVDMSVSSSYVLSIPVTIRNLPSVKLTVRNPNPELSATLDKVFLNSDSVINLTLQKLGLVSGASMELLFEGFSPTSGYVSWVTQVNIAFDKSFEFAKYNSAGLYDLSAYVEVEDYGRLNALINYSYEMPPLEVRADSNNVITIPSFSTIVAIKTKTPIRYDKIKLGISSFVSDRMSFKDEDRPKEVELTRTTNLYFREVSSYSASGFISYYRGTVPEVKVTIDPNTPNNALFTVLPEVKITTPSGLSVPATLKSRTYKFIYKK